MFKGLLGEFVERFSLVEIHQAMTRAQLAGTKNLATQEGVKAEWLETLVKFTIYHVREKLKDDQQKSSANQEDQGETDDELIHQQQQQQLHSN